MSAFSDAVDAVMCDYREIQSSAVDLVQRDIDGDGQAGRCCGKVREIYQRAQ